MKLDNYVIHDQNTVENTCYINLLTTERCNNACWYCCTDCHIKKEKYVDFDDNYFSKLLEFIDAQNRMYLDFHFIGGEPTLHPKLKEFARTLIDRYEFLDIHMTTNLMQPLDYWKDFPIKRPKGCITASFHSDWIKDPQIWLEKAYFLRDNNGLEIIFLMAQDGNLELLEGIYREHRDHLPLKISPIHQFSKNPKYLKWIHETGFIEHSEHNDSLETKDFIEVLLRDGTRDDANYEKYNNFLGMMCNSGYSVFPNGDIYYCWAETKPFMNLYHDDVKQIPPWHLCMSSKCTCEYQFRKVSIPFYVKHKDELCY